jgi:cell division protein FtsB
MREWRGSRIGAITRGLLGAEFVYHKALIFTLIVGALALQWALWAGKSNVVDLIYLQQTVASLKTNNASLRHRNDRLHADINEIKSRLEAIEARARKDLGLILPGETYYQTVLPEGSTSRISTD